MAPSGDMSARECCVEFGAIVCMLCKYVGSQAMLCKYVGYGEIEYNICAAEIRPAPRRGSAPSWLKYPVLERSNSSLREVLERPF